MLVMCLMAGQHVNVIQKVRRSLPSIRSSSTNQQTDTRSGGKKIQIDTLHCSRQCVQYCYNCSFDNPSAVGVVSQIYFYDNDSTSLIVAGSYPVKGSRNAIMTPPTVRDKPTNTALHIYILE